MVLENFEQSLQVLQFDGRNIVGTLNDYLVLIYVNLFNTI